MEGIKDVLGMWVAESERAKFRLYIYRTRCPHRTGVVYPALTYLPTTFCIAYRGEPMENFDKSREELLEELNQAGKRIAELEDSEANLKKIAENKQAVGATGSSAWEDKRGAWAANRYPGTGQPGEREISDASKYESLYSMMRMMCDNVPDLIWAKDLERRYIFANKAICEKLLYANTTEEPLGRNDMFFADRERRSNPGDPHWHTFGEICSDSDSVVMTSKKPDRFQEFGNVRGKFLCLDVYKAPFWNDQGEMIGTVGCARIITEEKRLEEERKHAQEALRESEARYRLLVDKAPVGIISVDMEGKILDVNGKLLEILGSPSAEATKSINTLTFEPMVRYGISGIFRKCLFEEVSVDLALPYTSKWGKKLYFRIIATPMRDHEGKVYGCLGVAEDITDRKSAEEALRQSEERYRGVYKISPLAFVLWDRDCLITDWNYKAERLFGWPPEEALGKNFLELLVPESDRPQVIDIVEKLLRGLSSNSSVNHNLTKTGEIIVCEWNNSILKDSSGNVVGVISLALDITERKRVQDALAESEEKYRLLVESAHEAILIAQDGCLRYANAAAEEMSGRTRDELLAKPFSEFIHPDDRDLVLERHYRRLRGESLPTRYSIRIVDNHGETRWVELDSVNIAWQDRPALLVCMTDITERRNAQELLLQAECYRAVADLASGVAHNFNNLLQIVMGGTQLIARKVEKGDFPGIRSTVARILESCQFGAETVKRLQSFAGVRTMTNRSETASFDLSDIVKQSVEMSKPWWKTEAEKKGVRVDLKMELGSGCVVNGKKNELFEVVVNLLKNSVEALPLGGVITVKTSVENHNVILTFEDTGVGISKDNIKRIFNPFFTTKAQVGTGLGLAASRSIVEEHAGEIHVESVEGKGTTFCLRFPQAEGWSQDSGAEEIMDSEHGLTLLVIDDVELMAETMKEGLGSYGNSVFDALSGEQGLEIFESQTVDAVVCDLGMPGMNGWQVGARIKEICLKKGLPKPPFIILTGWADQIAEIEKIHESGVDAVIEKPVVTNKLLELIKEMIHKTKEETIC
jgi:PAS domain S-box-containing protein